MQDLTLIFSYGSRLHEAQKKYRAYVAEGIGTPSPWEKLQGQIYLGSKDFVRKHQPDRVIREVPRRQTQAHRPKLADLFKSRGDRGRAIFEAYRRYGYRMIEIAEYLGVHYATVSRQIKRIENRLNV